MRSNAWRWLLCGGLLGGLAAGTACSSGDDEGSKQTAGKAGSGSGATGGTSAGTGAAGKPATAGTGGSSAGTGGAAGSMAGGAPLGGGGGTAGSGPAQGGAAGSLGTAGTLASGGAPAGGMAGSLGSGGAAAGNGGGGMPATLVTPIMRSATSYVLEFGDTYFEVNPMLGARITDVHPKGGTNVLGGNPTNAGSTGSTFWPSPQSAWTWPPTDTASITNINDKPYTASNDDTSMTLVGMAASSVGVSVTKKFAADLAHEAIVATYTLIGTAAGKSAAPWEITRFPQSGVTFYPTGSAPVAGNGMDLPPTTTGADCTWLASPGVFASASAPDQKMNADGTSGWLAHADAGWVVIRKFEDTPASMAATGEAEIEIYMNNPGNTSNSTPYMEVEIQGPYAAVGMGQMVNWTVTWFIRKLPSGVTATAGSQALVDFVKSVIE